MPALGFTAIVSGAIATADTGTKLRNGSKFTLLIAFDAMSSDESASISV